MHLDTMNKFIYFVALVLGGMGLQSCLDFDNEYSTLNSDAGINLDSVMQGKPDTLNYRVEISE